MAINHYVPHWYAKQWDIIWTIPKHFGKIVGHNSTKQLAQKDWYTYEFVGNGDLENEVFNKLDTKLCENHRLLLSELKSIENSNKKANLPSSMIDGFVEEMLWMELRGKVTREYCEELYDEHGGPLLKDEFAQELHCQYLKNGEEMVREMLDKMRRNFHFNIAYMPESILSGNRPIVYGPFGAYAISPDYFLLVDTEKTLMNHKHILPLWWDNNGDLYESYIENMTKNCETLLLSNKYFSYVIPILEKEIDRQKSFIEGADTSGVA